MRRSICYCEPNFTLAGTSSTWKFIYTTATPLAKGARLRFDPQSRGRPLDWQLPKTQAKEKENLIWLQLPNGKPVMAAEKENEQLGTALFEFVLPAEIKAGETLSICMGSFDADSKKGNVCQKTVQRRRPFYLWIDPKGKGEFKDQETFYLDVRGNELKNLRIITPSLVSRNKRFDVIVRFEDVYGNLTNHAPEGTLIDLSYQHLRENLNWKLFVPETGFIALPNLYFNEPGIYRIQLKNLLTEQIFHSSPIKCLPESSLNLYWGLLHGESERYDSLEHVESYLRQMRDDRALQFAALSPFESEEETSPDQWKHLSHQVAEFNEEDRFVAFLGFQWMGAVKEEGLRHFLYGKDGKPLLRAKDTKNNTLKKIYKTNNPKELVSIPSFTMGKKTAFDFQDFHSEFEHVAEIYNSWGSSECLEKEGNPFPIQGKKNAVGEAAEGSLRAALNRGRRFGFVAGGHDDRGVYRSFYDSEQKQYEPGLTAILAKEHHRTSLLEALQARSCYATTGKRIVLGLHIAGFAMGTEIDTKNRPGLCLNRHITGYVIGTSTLSEVLLIRNGKVWKSFPVSGEELEFSLDDSDALEEIALSPQEEELPFVYYYLRAMQKDGHMAWSSPIWVNLSPKNSSTGPIKKVKKRN